MAKIIWSVRVRDKSFLNHDATFMVQAANIGDAATAAIKAYMKSDMAQVAKYEHKPAPYVTSAVREGELEN